MNGIVRKMRPTDNNWQIGETESWLTDMATQGLHFKKMGSFFAKFEKGAPKRVHYRIKVTPTKKVPYIPIDFFEENGWDYIDSYQYFHVFSSPIERNAMEIPLIKSEEESSMFKMLNNNYQTGMISILLCAIIAIGSLLFTIFMNETPIYNLVVDNVLQIIFFFVIYINFSYQFIQVTKMLKQLRRHVLQKKPINHYAPWKKLMKKQYFITSLMLFLAMTLLYVTGYEILSYETKTLPMGDFDVPIVRLSDIEQNEQMIRDEYFIDGIDYSNYSFSKWSPLAPTQYEIRENGVIPGVNWEDNSGEYSPRLTTKIFDLRFSKLASGLIEDLIEREIYLEDRSEYVEVQHSKFDKLIVHEATHHYKGIYAAKGKRVMVVRYYGFANLEQVIEQVALKINM